MEVRDYYFPHSARKLLGQNIPETDEVTLHVLRPDAVCRQDCFRPGDVVGEEGRAGELDRSGKVVKVVLRVLDALGPPTLTVLLSQFRLEFVLPGDDGFGQRRSLRFNGLSRFSVTIRHGGPYDPARTGTFQHVTPTPQRLARRRQSSGGSRPTPTGNP